MTITLSTNQAIMKKFIVPISFAVMALAIAAMLPALVSAQTTTTSQEDSCYTFTTNFGVGSDGNRVARLTRILIREGFLPNDSKVFDEDLAAAVVKFQNNYGIPTTGYVGPLTRAKLNSLYGCTTQTKTPREFVCPSGYVCTPANQVSYTCPPGFICTPQGSTQTTTNTSTNSGGHQIDNIPGTTYGVYDVDVSTLAGLERRQAIRQLYLSLQHRDPDLQGLDYWVYMNADLQNIKDQMKAGIEYQTKQKIVQIFQDVNHRYPDDIELTKWYYTAEYFNYDTSKVRAALTGNTSVAVPVVTPVATTPVYIPSTTTCPVGYTCNVTTPVTEPTKVMGMVKCVFNGSSKNEECYSTDGRYRFSGVGTAGGQVGGTKDAQITWKSTCGGYAYTTNDGGNAYANFTCTPTTTTVAGSPVATLTVGGAHSYTYNVGQTNHYEWSSANADSFSSFSKANNSSQCGEGMWVANSAHGTSDTYILPQWAGCVWTVTYTAKNSSTGASASDTVVLTVNPTSSDTSAASGSRDAARP